MDIKEEALKLHSRNKGKIEINSKVKVESNGDLSLAYTPGVAEVCREIQRDETLSYEYTSKGNMIAVVTDGSAVLGLGNISSRAGMPVMEGKSILFKELGGVDAFPIGLESQDMEDIIFAIKQIAPSFGGINLEDIAATKCFEIEKRLKAELDIPVFHDDQHGTAIVVLAAIINSLKVVNKNISSVKIVINGAGAAGISIAKLLLRAGAKNIIICDRKGILNVEDSITNPSKMEIAQVTNLERISGNLKRAILGSDVFIGVSAPEALTSDDIKTMNNDAIVFAMANPTPEIYPEDAKLGGARIVGTGRSDFPNQINNILAFPGIFRGALDARASDINEEMKLAAAYTIAKLVAQEELSEEKILPRVLDKKVAIEVAKSVAKAAMDTGISRL
ncbi:MAG: NADP-dependent malic enzyme [Tissierellia bacterium]|nr:NADP-dependent malic enzyme [Tissierellia bacterium]